MSDKRHADESSRSTIALDHKEITPSGGDVNCATLWSDQTFVRQVRNGSAAPADIKVRTTGGNDVTFHNVPSGSSEYGYFDKVYNSGTTATNVVVGK